MSSPLDIEALAHAFDADPIYFQLNKPAELPWQVSLYRDRLEFLTADYHLRLVEFRPDLSNHHSTQVAMEYRAARTRLRVQVHDRERYLEICLGVRRLGVLWRWIDLGWAVLARTGSSDLVTQAEALAVGRDEARRLLIERRVAFVRTHLGPFLSGDPSILAEANAARRAYWLDGSNSPDAMQTRWRSDADAAAERSKRG